MLLLFFFAPFLFLGLLLVWLIPLGYTFRSLINIILVPKEFAGIFVNKKKRKNHALEHATVNVIEEKYGLTNLSGFAEDDGFIIKGFVEPQVVYDAALTGLERLKNGEKELVIHKRCGTSLVITNFLTSVLFILILIFTGQATIWTIILAIMLGSFLGPTFGLMTQKLVTTTSDVSDIRITGYFPSFGRLKILTETPEDEIRFIVE